MSKNAGRFRLDLPFSFAGERERDFPANSFSERELRAFTTSQAHSSISTMNYYSDQSSLGEAENIELPRTVTYAREIDTVDGAKSISLLRGGRAGQKCVKHTEEVSVDKEQSVRAKE
jgi:hypothetical protein